MEIFEKIKGDLRLRKQQKPRTVEDELFELYFKHYYDVRERNFGFDAVSAEDKRVIADTAQLEYAREIYKLLPSLEKSSKRSLFLTFALSISGLGLVLSQSIFDVESLGTIGVGLSCCAIANASFNLRGSRDRHSRHFAYSSDAWGFSNGVRYKDRAEKKFDEISKEQKQKNVEKIM